MLCLKLRKHHAVFYHYGSCVRFPSVFRYWICIGEYVFDVIHSVPSFTVRLKSFNHLVSFNAEKS